MKLKLPSLKKSTDSSRTEVTGALEEEVASGVVEEEVFDSLKPFAKKLTNKTKTFLRKPYLAFDLP